MEIQIETSHLEKSLNYIAKCPTLKHTSLKQRFVNFLFPICRNINKRQLPIFRKFISECPTELEEGFVFPSSSNAASVCISQDGTPYFSFDYIQITELIQKEDVTFLQNSIHTFLRKNCMDPHIPTAFDITDIFSQILSDHSAMPLGHGQIKKGSPLFKNFSSIFFYVCNLTSVFCSLHIYVSPNKDLQKTLSDFSTSHVSAQLTVSPKHLIDLFTFKNLGYGFHMGDSYKNSVLACVFDDLSWSVTSFLNKQNIPLCISPRQSIPPYILHTTTNVSGNHNKEFWSSMGINAKRCDYLMNSQTCISWGSIPMYIESSNLPLSHSSSSSYINPFIVDRYLAYIGISSSIQSYIRNKLLPYMREINTCHNPSFLRHTTNPLKLKCKIDREFYPYLRFINDTDSILTAKHPGITYHYNYQKLPLRKTDTNLSILDKRKNEIHGENQRLNNEYEQFYKILTSAVDLYKDDSNHRLQIIAIQISIIAIFISVFLEDDVRNLIVSFFDQLYTSLK